MRKQLRYGDSVKVIKGFYKDLTGHVTDKGDHPTQYYFRTNKFINGCSEYISAWIAEDHLRKIDETQQEDINERR